MTLIEIYRFIEFIGNKDFNGNFFRPDEFNVAIQLVNIDYFKKRFGLPEEYQPGNPVPRDIAEITQKSIDDLRLFKKHLLSQTVSSGKFTIPADYMYWDSMSYTYVHSFDGTPQNLLRPVELLREDQLADRLGNWIKKPTLKNPVCVIRADGTTNQIYVFPDTITSVGFHYWRMPVQPIFDYTVTDDELIYVPETSTEFEWPEICHGDLIRMLFVHLKINLNEMEIAQYAESWKQKGV